MFVSSQRVTMCPHESVCAVCSVRGAHSGRELSPQAVCLWAGPTQCRIQLVEQRPSSGPDPCIQETDRQREASRGGQGRQGELHM